MSVPTTTWTLLMVAPRAWQPNRIQTLRPRREEEWEGRRFVLMDADDVAVMAEFPSR